MFAKTDAVHEDVEVKKRLFQVVAVFTLFLFSDSAKVNRRIAAELDVDPSRPAISCYGMFSKLALNRLRKPSDQLVYSYGTDVPIAHAFEKEGLFYDDIDHWFDRLDPGAKTKLRDRLKTESEGKKPKALHKFLKQWPTDFRPSHYALMPKDAKGMSPEQLLERILQEENPLAAMNMKGKEAIFLEGILTFDEVRPAAETPEWLGVADDIGSYEVKTNSGIVDRTQFFERRALVEKDLDSSVGHQHLVHAWPDNAGVRAKIAPRYIELLDATTWYLYLRQLKRNPNEAASIVDHPYLGVYWKKSLEKLHDAVVSGDASKFKNKFRMVGARSVKPDPKVPQQAGRERLPDFELRSGNKSENRQFVEDMLEARLSSGDYSGLRDFRDSHFDPAAPIEELFKGRVNEQQMKTLKDFETAFKPMNYSSHASAYNQVRNKILVPLLPWRERLNLDHKADVIDRAQDRFAQGMAEIAARHMKKLSHANTRTKKMDLNAETMEAIQELNWRFATRTNLDEDFGHYLEVKPNKVADVRVRPPIDPNTIDLGIEYSFRFADKPRAKSKAETAIRTAAEKFRDALGGGDVTRKDDGGHGHGLSVRYEVKDPQGQTWRMEWDGISRSYKDGEPVNARGGHVEVPSPKFSPQNSKQIEQLFKTMRDMGLHPKRSAGGGHVNVDLAQLKALPEKEGARAMANLLALFESRRDMISFLWQHPYRDRVAIPIRHTDKFTKALNEFDGNWDELGALLYENQYYNPFVGRKPVYTQLNAAALMSSAIPKEYQQSIDIKKPGAEWFPSFGGKGKDRIEFRLFDAPKDENAAALQIKYVRALLNRSINSPVPLKMDNVYSEDAKAKWKSDAEAFHDAAKSHFDELGLSLEEYAPIVTEAWRQYQLPEKQRPALEPYDAWLPANTSR